MTIMTIKASSTSKYQAGSTIQRCLLQVPAIHAMFQHALHVFWWRTCRPRQSGWDMIWWMEGSKYDGWYDHWKFRNHEILHLINLIQNLQKCRCFKNLMCYLQIGLKYNSFQNRPFQRFFQLFPWRIMKNPGTVRDSVPHPRPPRRRHLGHSPAFASNK